MNAFDAVDAFLMERYAVALEEALCSACVLGRLSPALDGVVEIFAQPAQALVEDDGGRHFSYAGVLNLAGVSYRFRCHVFLDGGGTCFLSDVHTFEAVAWETRVAMPV